MGSRRCGGMAITFYLMAIVLLVALFASSAKCRPEPLDGDKASSSNGHAKDQLISSTAAAAAASSSVNGSSGGSGDVKLSFCIARSCVYEGRGNAPCFCCGAIKPNECYDTRDKCNANCV